MKKVVYSVIVPCYNAIGWIDKALQSLEKQTYKDFEVIMVDDCSSDGTYEYLKNYAETSSLNIRVFRNDKNSGPGESRNRALKEAGGLYIVFLDSDDWYDASFLECVYGRQKDTNADVVFFDFYRNWDNGKEVVISWTSVFSVHSTLKEHVALCYDSLCVMAIRKELFNSLDLPTLYNAEDTAMVPLLVAKAERITCIHKPLYHYLCRKQSLSTRINENVYQSFYHAYQYLKEHISDSYKEEVVFRGIKMIMYGVVYNAIRAKVPLGKFEYIIQEFQNENQNYTTNLYMKSLPMRKRIFIKCVENRMYGMLVFYCKLQEFILRIN